MQHSLHSFFYCISQEKLLYINSPYEEKASDTHFGRPSSGFRESIEVIDVIYVNENREKGVNG